MMGELWLYQCQSAMLQSQTMGEPAVWILQTKKYSHKIACRYLAAGQCNVIFFSFQVMLHHRLAVAHSSRQDRTAWTQRSKKIDMVARWKLHRNVLMVSRHL